MGELWFLGGVYSMLSGKVGGVIAAAAIMGTSLDRPWSGWCWGLVVPPIGVSTIIRLFSLDLGFDTWAAMSAKRLELKLLFSLGSLVVATVEVATVVTVLSGSAATDVVLVVVVLLVASVVNLIGLTVNALSS